MSILKFFFHIYGNISLNSSSYEKYFIQKLLRKTKHAFYILQRFYENRVVYETTSKNMVEPKRPQMKIQRMRFVCWVSKATRERTPTTTRSLAYTQSNM